MSLQFLPWSLCSFKRGVASLVSLRRHYLSLLSSLEQENQQQREVTAQLYTQCEDSGLTCEDEYGQAPLSCTLSDQPQPAHNRYQRYQSNKKLSQHLTLFVAVYILDLTNDRTVCRWWLTLKERSRGFSNSCRPCPLHLERTPAALPKTAGLSL